MEENWKELTLLRGPYQEEIKTLELQMEMRRDIQMQISKKGGLTPEFLKGLKIKQKEIEGEIKVQKKKLPFPVHPSYLNEGMEDFPLTGKLIEIHETQMKNRVGLRTYRQIAEEGFFMKKNSPKVSGKGFLSLGPQLAEVENRLVQFLRKENIEAGFQEISSLPLICNEEYFEKVGQLPKMKKDLFKVIGSKEGDKYLIPTGETSLMALMCNTYHTQPLRLFSLTECFRDEAGKNSQIKDYLRLKQFKKYEIVCIVDPLEELQELDRVRAHVTNLVKKMGFDYRVLLLHPTDLANQSRITYDIEIKLPITGVWVEISSISSCGQNQTNPLRIRYKGGLATSINASSLPLPRLLMAEIERLEILENLK